jgi:hypothetical protein
VECGNLASAAHAVSDWLSPTNDAKDGKWRRLSVKLQANEGGETQARIKRGYYADKTVQ